MQVSKDYLLRTIAGETILIPSGAAAQKFNGLVTVNAIGAFIWDVLQTPTDLEGWQRASQRNTMGDVHARRTRRSFSPSCGASARWKTDRAWSTFTRTFCPGWTTAQTVR